MHSTFYYVLIFNLFTTELCSGQQKSDNDGFRELNPAPQDRNFRNVYSPSGALGNIPDTYSSSTTEMPQLTGSDICEYNTLFFLAVNLEFIFFFYRKQA